MKIVIIGGVAAGASTAARARRLNEDAESVVLEKDAFISFANCGLPYHIGGEIKDRQALLLQTPKSLKASLNIDVRVNHEVTQIDRSLKQVTVIDHGQNRTYTENYERLVLSQGANALRPPIPGIDHKKIFVLRNIPDMDAIIKEIDDGAQVVGYDGVDKRIDVFATAIRASMTVFDLEHLELAYAPPYGSAKDPVNMAGFIAANFLRGDLDFWYAEDFPQQITNGTLLDVRSSKEFKNWSIPGAINIPLRELRSRLAELHTGQSIYIYCRVGFRSYLAYRILKQKGFEKVSILAGGSKTLNCFCRTELATGKPGVPFVAHAEEKLAEIPGALINA